MAGSGAKRATIGVADQILYSLTSFVMTLLVAHYSTADEFGRFAVLYATYLIAAAVNRGLAAEPLVVRFSTSSARECQLATQEGLALSFAWGLTVAVILCFVTLWLLPAAFLALGITFAAAVPFLFVQDYVRYAALAAARPVVALSNDIVVLIVQGVTAIIVIAAGEQSATVFLVAWCAASFLGGVGGLALLRLRPHPVALRAMWRQSDLATRLALDNLAMQTAQQGTAYVVTAFSGLAAAAGYRAAQTAFTPPALLGQGLQAAVLPELVRLRSTSPAAMRRALYFIAVGLFVVSTMFLVAILVMPRSVGVTLFGPSWSESTPLLLYIGVGMVAGSFVNTAVAGLRALADAARTLRARSAAIAITLGCVIPGGAIDGAKGVAIAIAVAVPAQAATWWIQFELSYRASAVLHPANDLARR